MGQGYHRNVRSHEQAEHQRDIWGYSFGTNQLFTSQIGGLTLCVFHLFPPNSDHVMIYLGSFNYAICHTQLNAWEKVQTGQW